MSRSSIPTPHERVFSVEWCGNTTIIENAEDIEGLGYLLRDRLGLETPGSETEPSEWRDLAHEAFLQLEYLHQRERQHSSTGAVLLRLSEKLGLPLDTPLSAALPSDGPGLLATKQDMDGRDDKPSPTPRTDALAKDAAHLTFNGKDGDADALWNLIHEYQDSHGHLERELAEQTEAADESSKEVDRIQALHTGLMAEADRRVETAEAALSATRERTEICHNPQGSHGRWSATERHCYSCGVTVKHGDDLQCQFVSKP